MRKGNAHIKWNDQVTPRLQLIPGNLAAAMDRGVNEVAATAVGTIRRRVETAVTATGRLRASGGAPRFKPRPAWFLHLGPGRIESGAMLASARWQMTVQNHQVRATAGFINAPRHTALQELGSTGRGAVPAMGAYALGHTKAASIFVPLMERYAGQALRAAQSGRSMRGVR